MRITFHTLALAAAACLASIAQAQTTGDASFAARCSAPGVIKCVGFDNTTADIVPGTNLFPDENGTIRGTLDTSLKASGGGSLRFDLPPPPHAGSNIAGRWSPEATGAFGRTFGQNSTFYVQYRLRLSPEMLTNTWDGYWKTSIFHQGSKSCASIELTTQNYYGTDMPIMYTDCGARGMFTKLDGSTLTENPPLIYQQGDYPCEDFESHPPSCYYFTANEWITLYYKVHVGTWYQTNSSVEAWVAREGATSYKQWIHVLNLKLGCNESPCGANEGYNTVTLTPYMTGLSTTAGKPGVTSRIWYDELVVSTQPIAVPGGSAPKQPNPPTNVTAN